jgi:transcriptional regulator with XRE-family HTH domain
MVKLNSSHFFEVLGKRIAQLRKEQGLTQEQLAEKLSITQVVLANYEVGKRRIPLSLLLPLKDALYSDIETLLDLEKKNKHGPSPKIQKLLAEIPKLPQSKQKLAIDFLETLIENSIKKGS